MNSSNIELTANECDFILDLLDSIKDGRVERAAKVNNANPRTVYRKLALYANIKQQIDSF